MGPGQGGCIMSRPVWTPTWPTAIDDSLSMRPVIAGDDSDVSQVNGVKNLLIDFENRLGIGSSSSAWEYLSTSNPSGVSASPAAVYQLDGTVDALTDRIGSHDLTEDAGTIQYIDSEGIVSGGFDSSTTLIASMTAALRITGALTMECLCSHWDGTQRVIMGVNEGPTESEANNTLYQMTSIVTTGAISYFNEYGGGSNSQVDFDGILPVGKLHLVTVTRDVSGNVNLYLNGDLIDTGATTPPTGGTTANLFIGGYFAAGNRWLGLVNSCRITAEEFSASEVASAFAQTRGL